MSKSLRLIAAAFEPLAGLVLSGHGPASAARWLPSPPVCPLRPQRPRRPRASRNLGPRSTTCPTNRAIFSPCSTSSTRISYELYKLKNQLQQRNQPPRYSLQRMTATGTAKEEYAELNLRFQVLVRDDDWVRIPLRLNQGLLRGAVAYKGAGRAFRYIMSPTATAMCVGFAGRPTRSMKLP